MNEKSVSISVYIENKITKIRLSPCVHITYCTVIFRYLWMLTSYVTGGCCHISVVSECYGSPLTNDNFCFRVSIMLPSLNDLLYIYWFRVYIFIFPEIQFGWYDSWKWSLISVIVMNELTSSWLLVKMLSIKVAVVGVIRVGLTIWGRNEWENRRFRLSRIGL